MYLSTIITKKTVIFGSVASYLFSILLPTKAFEVAFIGWLVAMIIDILTKYISIAIQSRDLTAEANNFVLRIIKKILGAPLYNALYHRKIRSDTLWRKTSKKFFEFIIILTCMSILYHVAPFQELVITFIKVVFFVAIGREIQSIIENGIDAGLDLEWLLLRVKKQIEEQTNDDN